MNLWWTVRSKTGVVAMSLGVLAAAGLAAAVPVLTRTASDQQPAGQVYELPAEAPATTTDAPAPAPAVDAPAPATVEPQPATVNTVTTPEQQAAAPADQQSIGTTGGDGYYTPAPPRQNPGEPPASPNFGSSGPIGGGAVTPLPGEPGYAGPTVEAAPKS